MEAEKVKCLIIGSGPAGYTAAIYAARANLSPVLYEGLQPGGQLTTTTDIENFPGYPEGISGTQMMEDLRKQAERFGADLRFGVATAADLSKSPYKITIDEEKVIEAQTVIIATGAAAKYLGLEDEKKYAGMGVSACATCDGFFYRKKVVAVVGGGEFDIEEARVRTHAGGKLGQRHLGPLAGLGGDRPGPQRDRILGEGHHHPPVVRRPGVDHRHMHPRRVARRAEHHARRKGKAAQKVGGRQAFAAGADDVFCDLADEWHPGLQV